MKIQRTVFSLNEKNLNSEIETNYAGDYIWEERRFSKRKESQFWDWNPGNDNEAGIAYNL